MDAHIHTLSRTAMVPVAAVDARGAVALWSPAARHLLGYTSGEIVGSPAIRLLTAPLPEPARRSLVEGTSWRGTVPALHQDGSIVRVTVETCSRPTGDGCVRWVLLAAPTAGTGLRNAMRATLKEWAYDQSPFALATYDHENRLMSINAQMLRRSGDLVEEDIVGQRLEEIHPGPPFDAFTGMLDQVLRTGHPLRADAFFRSPGDAGKRAWACFFDPLKDRTGHVRGVSAATLDITEQYRTQQRLSLVNDAGARIGTTLDIARTAEELVDVTAGRFADFVSVDLLDSVVRGEEPRPGGVDGTAPLRRAAARGGSPRPRGTSGTHSYLPHSPTALALASGKPSLHHIGEPGFSEWVRDTPALPDGVRARGVHSVLAVPLNARGIALGLALFVRQGDSPPFDADDLLPAQEIAARAGVCIDNARRYTQERAVAVTLQRSLLPSRLPDQDAVEVTSRYLPACTQAGVGGDWFDVIPLSGARVALVVGDVVGHGLQASAVMGRLRAAVRTLADLELPPDELLTHLDDLVIQLAQDQAAECADDTRAAVRETGATCLYVVYDPVSRMCAVARAGHPAPVLVSPDGVARYLDMPSGPPLGLGGLPFEATELELPEGSLLALYTDGLVEGGDDHDIGVGLDKLSAALSGPAAPLERTCDAVLGALLPGRAERHADDVALLLARTRVLGASDVADWELLSDRAAVADARKRASGQLAAWGLEELDFTTELIVSELVTNAIRYGHAPIRLRLIRGAGALICEVSDTAHTSPRMRRARILDEGGRGLLLVAQFAERWGTRFTPEGKTIWAEQPLAAAG
ncbi:SpoIIE family protein phosphatase [Streptomyces sp. NPDC020379]|uniref:SpoIIE family protein phosphatase n=1 Tax=Streptomyces sp. NPDC020379 TaxID=3365071 RepID=UPI00378D6495